MSRFLKRKRRQGLRDDVTEAFKSYKLEQEAKEAKLKMKNEKLKLPPIKKVEQTPPPVPKPVVKPVEKPVIVPKPVEKTAGNRRQAAGESKPVQKPAVKPVEIKKETLANINITSEQKEFFDKIIQKENEIKLYKGFYLAHIVKAGSGYHYTLIELTSNSKPGEKDLVKKYIDHLIYLENISKVPAAIETAYLRINDRLKIEEQKKIMPVQPKITEKSPVEKEYDKWVSEIEKLRRENAELRAKCESINIKPIKSEFRIQNSELKGSGYKISYGNALDIITQAEKIPAKYGLMEIDDLIPSNDWRTFAINEKYPLGCQERQYQTDKNEQARVIEYAQNLNPRFLILDDPTPENGSPVVTREGYVLGGNKRTMAMLRAKYQIKSNWLLYKFELGQKLTWFGFTQEQFKKFKDPVLVRIVAIDLSKCSHYSWILNTSAKQEVKTEVRAKALAKDISEAALISLGEVMESAVKYDEDGQPKPMTFSDMFGDRQISDKLISILRNAGIINNQNNGLWIDDGKFTDTGRQTLQFMLINVILNDKQLIDEAKNYTDKIVKAIPAFLRLKRITGKWNLLKYFEAAIRAEDERRTAGMTKSTFLNQTSFVKNTVDAETKAAWEILDFPVDTFKFIITKLAGIAETRANESNSDLMFEVETVEPVTVLRAAVADGNDMEKAKAERRKKSKEGMSDSVGQTPSSVNTGRLDKYTVKKKKTNIFYKIGRK